VEVIIDTSVIVAIVTDESDGERYEELILSATDKRMSAVSVYEATTVLLRRYRGALVDDVYELLATARIEVIAFDERQAIVASEGYKHFGKGLSSVGLNLGDCPVYALARIFNAPVLSTSDEFARAGLATVQLPRQ
jgi:ribonuclease VapC